MLSSSLFSFSAFSRSTLLSLVFAVVIIIIIFTTYDNAHAAASASTPPTVTPPGRNLKPDDKTRSENFGPIYLVPPSPTECNSLIVMLHGLGDTGRGWMEPTAELVGLGLGRCVVLPTARKMLVKVAKQATTAWFDVSEARFRDLRQDVDADEVRASAEYVLKVTRAEMKKWYVPWSRVIFGGFSQGSAVALFAGLTAPETPAGIVSIGGFLGAQSDLLGRGVMKQLRSATNVTFLHGDADKVVDIAHARHAVKSLKQAGVRGAKLHEFAGLAHGLDDASMAKLKSWVDERLAAAEQADDL